MKGIPNIITLFQAILNNSAVIDGRLFYMPKLGAELNTSAINDILTAYQPTNPEGSPAKIKYPCALMVAVEKSGEQQYEMGGNMAQTAGEFDIYMMFVRPQKLGAYNQASQPMNAQNNNLSIHTLAETHHDMDRCAKGFLMALQSVYDLAVSNGGLQWYLKDGVKQKSLFFSEVGNDCVSGVLIRFVFGINQACENEDYADFNPATFEIPEWIDYHPSHPNT